MPDRKRLRGQGSIGEPPDIRRAPCSIQSIAAQKAEIKEQPAECGHPETERVETWERHVARADHQRHKIVSESKYQGHRDEENHRRAVHREHPVEDLRRDEVVMRPDELETHDGGFHAAYK